MVKCNAAIIHGRMVRWNICQLNTKRYFVSSFVVEFIQNELFVSFHKAIRSHGGLPKPFSALLGVCGWEHPVFAIYAIMLRQTFFLTLIFEMVPVARLSFF